MDEYGGSIENRARYPVEVLKAVKAAVKIPVVVRINATEYGAKEIFGVDKEYTLKDAISFARIYEANGADALGISTWGFGPYVHYGLFPLEWGERLPMVAEIKKAVRIPVIGYGKPSPEMAEAAIAEGKADFMGFGRAQIAEPFLVQKIADGKLADITPCICCYRCEPISQHGLPPTGSHCSTNARDGYEAEFPYPLTKASKSKKVVVVGGGPAGMEAARVAAIRGHKVTLYEKSNKLGGQTLAADKAPEKQNMAVLAPYLSQQIKKLGVEIKLEEEATAAAILRQKPDAVIVAAGASPIIPQVKGLEKGNVVAAIDVLLGKADAGDKVVIIGSSLVGLEVGQVLGEQGKKLTVCETLPEIGNKVNVHTRDIGAKRIREHGGVFYVGVKSEEVTDKGMRIVDKDGKEHFFEADTIVLAAGSKPNNGLYTELKDKVPEIYCVGDASEPRYVLEAVAEGFRAAYQL